MPLQMSVTLERIFRILKYIEANPDCSITEISQALAISPTTVRVIVNALQEVGLVTRTVEGMPRRSKIKLTEAGKCFAECVNKLTPPET